MYVCINYFIEIIDDFKLKLNTAVGTDVGLPRQYYT